MAFWIVLVSRQNSLWRNWHGDQFQVFHLRYEADAACQEGSPLIVLFIEDLYVGQSAALTHVVDESRIAAFAETTGDKNPVHLDANYAAATRFGARIAHGMLGAGFISAVIGTVLPGPGSIYIGQSLRFRRPIYIGDEVQTLVEIVSIDRERNRVMLATRCIVKGKAVIDGEAEILVPGRNDS